MKRTILNRVAVSVVAVGCLLAPMVFGVFTSTGCSYLGNVGQIWFCAVVYNDPCEPIDWAKGTGFVEELIQVNCPSEPDASNASAAMEQAAKDKLSMNGLGVGLDGYQHVVGCKAFSPAQRPKPYKVIKVGSATAPCDTTKFAFDNDAETITVATACNFVDTSAPDQALVCNSPQASACAPYVPNPSDLLQPTSCATCFVNKCCPSFETGIGNAAASGDTLAFLNCWENTISPAPCPVNGNPVAQQFGACMTVNCNGACVVPMSRKYINRDAGEKPYDDYESDAGDAGDAEDESDAQAP